MCNMDVESISQLVYTQIKKQPDRKELKIIANSDYKVFLSDTAPVPSYEVVKKFLTRVFARTHL